MACPGQIESHVASAMTARQLIREAEDKQLPRSQRLKLLSEATGAAHDAVAAVGLIPVLRELLSECTTRFLEVCGER